MSEPRRHVWQFANRVLAERFFAHPARVVKRLSGPDGAAWLDGCWLEAGRLLAPDEHLPGPPSYEFEPVSTHWKVIVVRMPTPEHIGEPRFVALCHRPPQATFLVFATEAQARYFVWEQSGEVREWTADGQFDVVTSLTGRQRQDLATWLREQLE